MDTGCCVCLAGILCKLRRPTITGVLPPRATSPLEGDVGEKHSAVCYHCMLPHSLDLAVKSLCVYGCVTKGTAPKFDYANATVIVGVPCLHPL